MRRKTIKKDCTPDVIARNIKKVDEDIIEIRRYNDSNYKADGAWIWFVVVLCIWSYDISHKGDIHSEIQWAISVDARLKPQYNVIRDMYLHRKQPEKITLYKTWKADMLERHGHRRYIGAVLIAIPLLLFLWVASPHWRPLRFDSRRRLVYFWTWGQLYIERYPEIAQQQNDVMGYLDIKMFRPWIRKHGDGALCFILPHEENISKCKTIPVGIFKPACHDQNYVLKDFLNDYLSSDTPNEEFGHYFVKENRFISSDFINFFYHFTLFPHIGYNEEKIEARIQQWLANNPE